MPKYKPSKMSGSKPFLIWKEKKYGQTQPSRLDSASSFAEAVKKASRSKYAATYILSIKEVHQVKLAPTIAIHHRSRRKK